LHPCRRAGLLAGALSGSSLPHLSCDISTCRLHAGAGPVRFDGDRACPLGPLHRASTSFSPLYLISLPAGLLAGGGPVHAHGALARMLPLPPCAQDSEIAGWPSVTCVVVSACCVDCSPMLSLFLFLFFLLLVL